MRRTLLAALAILAPLAPLAAQDAPEPPWTGALQAPAGSPEEFAKRYRAALAAFVLPGQPPGEAAADDAAVVELLPTLEGRWLRNALAFGLDPAAPEADRIAMGCERGGAVLARTSPRSFELRLAIDPREPEATYSERYDLVVGNTFLRSFDEAGYLRRLFGPRADTEEGLASLPAPLVANSLAVAGRGEVVLFHPSPEILAIVQPGHPTDLWLRCP